MIPHRLHGISLCIHDEGGNNVRTWFFFRSCKGSAMGASDECGDASTLQEWDMGSRPLFTSPKSDRMSMDADGTDNQYKAPTYSKRLCANTHSRLRRDLCSDGKDDYHSNRDRARSSQRVASPLNGRQECLSSRGIRWGGVHGTTNWFQVEHTTTSGMKTQKASLRPQAGT